MLDEFEHLEPLPESKRQGQTDDPEHQRLFQEGWRWSTNVEKTTKDNCVAELQAKGYKVHICHLAYRTNGNLLSKYVSCWIKEAKEV